MIKSDFVKRLSSELNLQEKDALFVIDSLVESIKEVVIEHDRVELRDFGVFQVKVRKPRVGRNPNTLEVYPIPKKKVVVFKPGKTLKDL